MNNQQVNQLEKILSTYYQIGTLKEYQQLHLGYVNISYIIETEIAGVRKKYFLRRYKQGIKKEEIAFEHSVIAYLTAKGYNLIADVVKTKEGKTFIIRSAGRDRRKEFFYAVFDFLPGEDRYSWVNPTCTDKEVEGAAVVLAEFHNAVSDLIPAGRRYELGIMELLPEIAAYVDSCTQRPGSTVFDSYIQMHFALIQDAITKTQLALEHQDHQKNAQACDP